jgi:signal transduction histidine kinase
MGRDRSTGARAVAALVLTAAAAFALVGTASYVAAHRIARADTLADALRTAHGVGTAVVEPELGPALDGDRAAAADLATAVATRREDGTLARVMVWGRGGVVLWSDDRALIGRTLPDDPQVADVFARGQDYASISSLTDSQQQAGQEPSPLVEAYVPMTLAGGRQVVLEMLFPGSRFQQEERELSDRIVPLTLLALLVLAVAQLPVAIWLVRRTAAAQHDRDRMLETVLVASERERRLLARHLHDGVVQELAGAAFLLTARGSGPEVPASTRQVVGVATETLHRAVGDLREMLVELHPRELTGDNLGDLVATSAIRACPDQKVAVTARVVRRPLRPEVAAFLYRCARECALNVAKHAGADSVDITVDSDEAGIRLVVRDDGVGIAPGALDRCDGHLGLVLLRDAAADLGGSLTVVGGPGGTVVTVGLPPA